MAFNAFSLAIFSTYFEATDIAFIEELQRSLGFEDVSIEVFLNFLNSNKTTFHDEYNPLKALILAKINYESSKGNIDELKNALNFLAKTKFIEESDYINLKTFKNYLLNRTSEGRRYKSNDDIKRLNINKHIYHALRKAGFVKINDITQYIERYGINSFILEVKNLGISSYNVLEKALQEQGYLES